jgi:hypothetical protein
MRRITPAAGLLAGLGLMMASATRGDDTGVYTDRAAKKSVPLQGIIQKETALGLTIKVGKDDKLIPAEDVEYVNYKLPVPNPSQNDVDFAYGTETVDANKPGATPEERAAALTKALGLYQALDKKFSGKEAEGQKRYVQYRIALIAVRMAKDDPTKADDAVKALTDYTAANKGGWEIVPAVKTLAGMLEEKGDIKGAKEAYEKLAEGTDVPEVKLAANMKAVKLLMRASDYKGAQDKLEGVAGGLKPDDPQRAYVTVYLAQSRLAQNKADQKVEGDLKAAAAGGDDNLKALAHNTLGEYYELAKKPDEAFWQYLRVDVLYGQDKEEGARALYHLWKIFEASPRSDAVRSQQCFDRLVSPAFAGTEYQERALKEKKAP